MDPRAEAILLILVNATAAAAWFVGSMLLIFRLKLGALGPLGMVVGLVGVGYFVQRAEAQREKLRRRQP